MRASVMGASSKDQSVSIFAIFATVLNALFNHQAKDNINYYLFAWAHVIDATYVSRRVGAMQPYAEK